MKDETKDGGFVKLPAMDEPMTSCTLQFGDEPPGAYLDHFLSYQAAVAVYSTLGPQDEDVEEVVGCLGGVAGDAEVRTAALRRNLLRKIARAILAGVDFERLKEVGGG